MEYVINLIMISSMIIFFLIGTIGCSEKLVELKIVDQPSSFGLNYGYNGQATNQADDGLVLRVQPANFSGPQHFKRLIGRCFEAVINNYKYKFCPYSNVTQHEQDVNWNPYRGVLGVWQEWEVKNNTYVAMLMKDGDECGDISRSVRVSFACGNHSDIVNVSEPSRCSYQMTFVTPLVCAENSMLVYPSLGPDLQHLWNVLESERLAEELTDKGYIKMLGNIFEKAGIYLSREDKNVLVKNAEKEKHERILKDGDFETLDQCKEEFKKLQEQVKSLMAQLGIGGNTNKGGWPNDTVSH